MNNLQIFKNSEFGQVRVRINQAEKPEFNLGDTCFSLGYTKESKGNLYLTKDRIENICKSLGIKGLYAPYNEIEITKEVDFDKTWIAEEFLYDLMLESQAKNARGFRKWITHEVLPTIRKHGAYAVDVLLNDPDLAIKAFTVLKEEKQKRIQAQKQLEVQKPKVLFANAVETAKTSILIGDLAKIIKQNGYDIGQKRLFEWLRQNDYLIKSGSSKNMPTQYSIDLGLFGVKESTVNNPDGSVRITKTTMATGKGQIYFINKFLAKNTSKEFG